MTTLDRQVVISGCQWLVEYLDGRWVSDNERNWQEISVPWFHGKNLLILQEPAASISAIVGGREYTLRAPDRETRFFRYFHGRVAPSGVGETLYHAIGYVASFGKVTVEIDMRGNCKTRVEPSS